MNESESPLASPTVEDVARALVREGLSPEEYAARRAHGIACFSLDGYRYRDSRVQGWIHSMGSILSQRPGAPSLEDLRSRFLTAEERRAIRREQEAGEF